MLEVLYDHAKLGGARISPAAGVAKNVKFFVTGSRYLVYSEADFEVFRPAGAYPLHDFHKIYSICTLLQDALGVKIWLDLLEGLWSYGVLSSGGPVTPKLSAPPAAKLCVRPQMF